jgi:hypothetical protein
VAQLVAHFHGMEGVRGSNPLSSTEHEMAPGQRKRWSGAISLAAASDDWPALKLPMLDQLPD